MLFFVASFLSFVLLASKFQPLPSWASEMRLLSVLLFQEFIFASVQLLKSYSLIVATTILKFPSRMSLRWKLVSKLENVETPEALSVLDLPELVLESILGRLSPAGLCNMGAVCSSMRDRCRSDHLWERHMREKWYAVIGEAARQEWQLYIASRKDSSCCVSSEGKTKEWIGSLSCVWPPSWLRSWLDSGSKPTNSLPVDSIMSWYLALETGRFWFPAQIYNRENGHVGFMLSCYDAELSYDSKTDTFHARYPPHSRHTIMLEEGVQWERLRVPPLDTTGHNLHTSDCLTDLCPGNHIEIQWRRNKEFPYGWWYGVVGHLESCDGNELHCRCHNSETVVLEFKQYALGSRWRRASINWKDHREEGNETVGFYGGIRKLQNKEEISMWRRLWPMEILE